MKLMALVDTLHLWVTNLESLSADDVERETTGFGRSEQLLTRLTRVTCEDIVDRPISETEHQYQCCLLATTMLINSHRHKVGSNDLC